MRTWVIPGRGLVIQNGRVVIKNDAWVIYSAFGHTVFAFWDVKIVFHLFHAFQRSMVEHGTDLGHRNKLLCNVISQFACEQFSV